MGKFAMTVLVIAVSLGLFASTGSSEVTLGLELKIPPHYEPGSGGCTPGRGYSFSAKASNHPSTYPKLNLRVFNGEIIGFIFEIEAKEG
jgi:hypothetical protein